MHIHWVYDCSLHETLEILDLYIGDLHLMTSSLNFMVEVCSTCNCTWWSILWSCQTGRILSPTVKKMKVHFHTLMPHNFFTLTKLQDGKGKSAEIYGVTKRKKKQKQNGMKVKRNAHILNQYFLWHDRTWSLLKTRYYLITVRRPWQHLLIHGN